MFSPPRDIDLRYYSNETYKLMDNRIEFYRNTQIGNVGIFALLKFENKLDIVITRINFISKKHDKCKYALKFIELVTTLSIIPLEVVQRCQLCVLRENSSN